MKKITLETSFEMYPTPDLLPDSFQRLLSMARTALDSSYAPYSKFNVGAAFLLDNGEIILGSNQENAAYSMCLCAERVGLANINIQFPKAKIEAVAITAHTAKVDIDQPLAPCGACRQSLREQELRQRQSIKLILKGNSGPIYVIPEVSTLLPFSFDGEYL